MQPLENPTGVTRALGAFTWFADTGMGYADECRFTVYASDADEDEDEDEDDMEDPASQTLMVIAVVEGGSADAPEREKMRLTIPQEHYDEFCYVLNWLCRQSGMAKFVSLNHSCASMTEIEKAITTLHQEEIAQAGEMIESISDLISELARGASSIEPDDDHVKPTLH